MSRWTVMLVPHGHGVTRTLNLHVYQLWAVVAVLAVLTFSCTFMYARSAKWRAHAESVAAQNRQLRMQPVAAAVPEPAARMTDDEREALAEQIRAEYAARDATLTALLTDVLEMEARVREINGLEPRDMSTAVPIEEGAGGQGGPDADVVEVAYLATKGNLRPPSLIDGYARPSADLLAQEMYVRIASLKGYVVQHEAQRDKFERTPSILPSRDPRRKITSRFGLRRDPFDTRSVRHHNGLDVSGPVGSRVLATARGTVVEAEYDGGGLGYYVKIDHGDGLETVYGHLQKILAQGGARVEKGEAIGLLGSTGRSTGPHIHYEVYRDGKSVDPEFFIGN